MKRLFLPYNPARFHGGAVSWAAQGFCSICRGTYAEWVVKHGKGYRAYCDDCKARSCK